MSTSRHPVGGPLRLSAGLLLAAWLAAGCGSGPASPPSAGSASPTAAGPSGAAGATGAGPDATGATPGASGSTPSAAPTAAPGLAAWLPASGATRAADALQAELDRLRAAGHLPGLSAAILFADGSEWQGVSGSADLAAGRSVTPDTLFSVGSITKTFVAALVLRLADEGRLGLDDPIARWLSSYPDAARISVRELLEHRGGVPDFFDSAACVDRIVAAPEVAWMPSQVLACAGRPTAAPGTAFHYSNTGYVLLGRIVEAVTGTSLAAALEAEFLAPFSLDRVVLQGTDAADVPAPPIAHGYLAPAAAGGPPLDVTRADRLLPYTSLATAAGAAGALAATPTDLARWARSLFGGAVLDTGTVDEMTTLLPTAPDPRGGYGLGVEPFLLAGRPGWGHRGHLAGFYAEMVYLPRDALAIAVATNADWAAPDALTAALVRVALPAPDPSRRRGPRGGTSE